jgi:hypothetical protein
VDCGDLSSGWRGLRRSRRNGAEPTWRSCERKEFICLGRRRLLLERWVRTSDGKDLRRSGGKEG